jgi:hypothetical protein
MRFCSRRNLQSLNEIARKLELLDNINIIVLNGMPHNQEPMETGIRETLRLVWGPCPTGSTPPGAGTAR